MNTTVDARGLSCPQPVMMSQKAIARGLFPIEVYVDTVTSREMSAGWLRVWAAK